MLLVHNKTVLISLNSLMIIVEEPVKTQKKYFGTLYISSFRPQHFVRQWLNFLKVMFHMVLTVNTHPNTH